MGEFFHGWRRKMGILTLVMALAVTGIWMRSVTMGGATKFHFAGRSHWLLTVHGELTWMSVNTADATASLDEVVKAPPSTKVFPLHSPALWLTLLSAYLILWKPRKRQSTSPTNPWTAQQVAESGN